MVALLTRSDVDNLVEPANTFKWVFTVFGVTDIPILNPIYVLNAQVPMNSLGKVEKFRGGIYYKFPTVNNLGSLNLTFYETQSYYVTSWLESWNKTILDSNGMGLPSDYLGVGELVAFDTTGIPRLSLTFNGLWPESISQLEWNQESRQLEVSCEFSVNSIEMITAYTLANNVLSAVGISASSLLGDIGLNALGALI